VSVVLDTISLIKLVVELVIKCYQFLHEQRRVRDIAKRKRLLRDWAIGIGLSVISVGVLYATINYYNRLGDSPTAEMV
jgi:hypothetical protein